MNAVLQSIFSIEAYETRIDRIKAIFVYTLISIMFVVVNVVGITGVIDGGIVSAYIPLAALATLLLAYGLVRTKRMTIANWVLIITLSLLIIANNILDGSLGSLTLLLNVTLLILAGFLLETPGIIVIMISNVVQVFAFSGIAGLANNDLQSRVPIAVVYLLVSLIIYAYNRFIVASQLTGQDLESGERLKLAEINAKITQQASTRESLDTALNATLALILDNYETLYHAQIFLINEDGIQARLVASTGDAGKQLLARNHRLAVGSLSVIGQSTFSGEVVVTQVNAPDSIHRANDLLPDTTLEAAFPLRVGQKIIGALDLQSKVLKDLSANDRLTFQSLADSLSLAIDSISQFEQAQARIDENQRLAEQTRTALREVERLNQRLIGRAWSEYSKGIDDLGYAIDFTNEQTTVYNDWTHTLLDAVQSNNLVQDSNVIAIPLRVRGQVIGAMEFELNANQEFEPEDLELIMEVSERFGLAAENTRLVEESQQTAQREMLINQITGRFQSAQNVEATLAEAARSLSETLSADKVMIRLGVPQQSTNGKDS